MLQDHRDLLLAFNECHVKYLLVGGHALGRYAEPRATRDMDVFIEASPDNSQRVFAGLAKYGAPLAGYSPTDFQNPYEGFQIGAPPQQIDLIFAISGVSFQEAWADSLEGTIFDEIPVRYLSADHFIRNKNAAGRLQDLADVAAVLAARKANEPPEE
ncbi:hypothetical protein SAMN05421819_0411 [Bryocella elongata]|uniref:Nucleotidyl transferase AbiEii toxin, Type IV TA system n=1 Tax=Bryocella elongata TaxID=863522 RepID=A0A1H5SZ71_9BACT|nr:hypothetical protein [Bryocella elongata]SEF55805.1 hypothetical protein SAMN05421819_0411 [Bryocella elongata]